MEKAQPKGSMYHSSKEDRIRAVLKDYLEKDDLCSCGGPGCSPHFEALVKRLVDITKNA